MAPLALGAYLDEVRALIREGEFPTAAEVLAYLGGLFPNCILIHRLLGELALAREEYSAAVKHFRQVLDRDPEDFIAHAYLASLLEEDDVPAAIWHLERGWELNPGEESFRRDLFRLYSIRDGKEPERVDLTPASFVRLLLGVHRYQQALEELQPLLQREPDRVDLLLLLARCLLYLGRQWEVAARCEKILEAHPQNLAALLLLGTILKNSGQDEEAQTLFERARGLDPEYRRAQELLGADSPLLPEEVLIPRIGEVAPAPVPEEELAAPMAPELPPTVKAPAEEPIIERVEEPVLSQEEEIPSEAMAPEAVREKMPPEAEIHAEEVTEAVEAVVPEEAPRAEAEELPQPPPEPEMVIEAPTEELPPEEPKPEIEAEEAIVAEVPAAEMPPAPEPLSEEVLGGVEVPEEAPKVEEEVPQLLPEPQLAEEEAAEPTMAEIEVILEQLGEAVVPEEAPRPEAEELPQLPPEPEMAEEAPTEGMQPPLEEPKPEIVPEEVIPAEIPAEEVPSIPEPVVEEEILVEPFGEEEFPEELFEEIPPRAEEPEMPEEKTFAEPAVPAMPRSPKSEPVSEGEIPMEKSIGETRSEVPEVEIPEGAPAREVEEVPITMEEALSFLDKYPNDAEARLTVARLYAAQKDWAAALSHYQALIPASSEVLEAIIADLESREDIPHISTLYQLLGDAHMMTGKVNKALAYYTRLMEKSG